MRIIYVKCFVLSAIILAVFCSLSMSGVVAAEESASPNLGPTPTPTAGELVSPTLGPTTPSETPSEMVRPADTPQHVTAKAAPTELVVGLAGVSLSATEVAIASSLVVALVIGLALVLWKLR